VELSFPTAPREIRPADVSDAAERMKLLELEGEGGEWQNFGWCVREEDGIKDLDKSVEFISKILEEEVYFPTWARWCGLWFPVVSVRILEFVIDPSAIALSVFELHGVRDD